MPYVVTMISPCPGVMVCPDLTSGHTSCRAAATLEDARLHAYDFHGAPRQAVARIPESGGTIGPLSDGTIIKIEPKVWKWLYDRSGARLLKPIQVCTKEEVIAAFNAEHTSSEHAPLKDAEALDQRMRQIQYHASKATNCLNVNQIPEALVHINEITRLTSDADLVRYRNERLGKAVRSGS